MGNSAILKSAVAKKYLMAATGLFLCIFLIGHLFGNLKLLETGYSGRLRFNEYAVFMTSNPFVVLLSWATYISIIFHVVDGFLLTIQGKRARKKGYVVNKSSKNSKWTSRNMALLGTIILAFIVIHMSQFWYQYHYGSTPYMHAEAGSGYVIKTGGLTLQNAVNVKNATIKDGIVYSAQGEKVGEAMQDLYASVELAFKSLWMVILYVIAMIAIAFHLSHGVQSAFQSFGLRRERYKKNIIRFGYAFCIIIPLLFAIIPVIVHFR